MTIYKNLINKYVTRYTIPINPNLSDFICRKYTYILERLPNLSWILYNGNGDVWRGEWTKEALDAAQYSYESIVWREVYKAACCDLMQAKGLDEGTRSELVSRVSELEHALKNI